MSILTHIEIMIWDSDSFLKEGMSRGLIAPSALSNQNREDAWEWDSFVKEGLSSGLIDASVLSDSFVGEEPNKGIIASNQGWKKDWNKRIAQVYDVETRCICSLFVRLLERYRTTNTWRLLLKCVNRSPSDIIRTGETANLEIEFDFFLFESLSEYDKKRMTLEIIMKGARPIAEQAGWNIKDFEDVYQKIINLDYKNEYYHKEHIHNRNRRYHVSMLCVHEVYSMDMFLILKDKSDNELIKKQIVHTTASEWDFYMYLGKLSWISDTAVRLAYKRYKGGDFSDKEESGMVLNFEEIIEKYENGEEGSISENDVSIQKLFGEWVRKTGEII